MGCKSSDMNNIRKETTAQTLLNLIDVDADKQIDFSVEITEIKIDEIIVKINDIELNPLAYALFKGKTKSFRFLHEQLNASISKMEKILSKQGFSTLALVCKTGSLELFKYYLEIYTPYESELNEDTFFKEKPEFSLNFESVHTRLPLKTENLAFICCENGFIAILAEIIEFCKGLNFIPPELDVHWINENNGENCALIASRKGNYNLIKFLYKAGIDFSLKNYKGENALQVLLYSNKQKSLIEMKNCFQLLVNYCLVDVSYNYEETFLLIDDPSLVKFFEEQLKKKGILITKHEVEQKYMIFCGDGPSELNLNDTQVMQNFVSCSQNSSFISVIQKESVSTKSFLSNFDGII